MQPMIYAAEFEKTVIRGMCGHVINAALLDDILSNPAKEYNYSGCGYFLTFEHPALPVERNIYHENSYYGTHEYINSGFVIIVRDNQLTLECHSWGDPMVTADYRERPIFVGTSQDEVFESHPLPTRIPLSKRFFRLFGLD